MQQGLVLQGQERHFIYVSGIFFVLPCIETYQQVDLRTITLDVPPQEVTQTKKIMTNGAASDFLRSLHDAQRQKAKERSSVETDDDSMPV